MLFTFLLRISKLRTDFIGDYTAKLKFIVDINYRYCNLKLKNIAS